MGKMMVRKLAIIMVTMMLVFVGFVWNQAARASEEANENGLISIMEQDAEDYAKSEKGGIRIKKQPQNASAKVGEVVKYTIKASGSKIKYEWQFRNSKGKWAKVSSSTAKKATLQIKVKGNLDKTLYRCKLTDKNGNEKYSRNVKLTVLPYIGKQSKDQEVEIGQSFTLFVKATGSELSYQWSYKDDGSKWTNISGKKGKKSELSVTATEKMNGRQYRCLVKCSNGKKTSSKNISVKIKTVITEQPSSVQVQEGQDIVLNVKAKGADLTYQWQYQLAEDEEWINVSDTSATTNTLTIVSSYIMNGRSYRCCITDANGDTAISDIANVTIRLRNVELTANEYDLLVSSENQEIIFSTTVRDIAEIQKVELIDQSGNTVSEMLDDGLYSISGDDLPNDGIYSCRVSIDTSAEKTLEYHSIVSAVENNESNVVTIFVITDITQGIMKETDNYIQEKLEEANFSIQGESERKETVQKVLAELVSNGSIKDNISFSEANGLFTFEYANGALGGVMIKPFGEENDGIDALPREETFSKPVTVPVPGTAANRKEFHSGIGRAGIYFAFESTTYRLDYYKNTVIPEWESKGLNTDFITGVTVYDLKKLNGSKYNIIVIAMHGSYYNDSPVFCLKEQASAESDKIYSGDFKEKNIAKVYYDKNYYYWVFPSLFRNRIKDNALSGAFVYAQPCNGLGDGSINEAMANAFLSKGATAYIGIYNSVNSDYNRRFMKLYVDGLIDGKTARESFNYCVQEYGENDGKVTKPGTPMFRGQSNAVLIETGLKNGDFEEGKTALHWIQTGDARVISRLGSISAPQGNNMALLTTGIGSAEVTYLSGTEGSSISQAFRVPSTANSISLKYNVISEEPEEYIGTKYDDTVLFEILDRSGNVLLQLAKESINESTWIPLADINFEGGDDTTYQTGWKNVMVDISHLQTQTVVLRIITYDKGDSIYDTAVLVDEIVLN